MAATQLKARLGLQTRPPRVLLCISTLPTVGSMWPFCFNPPYRLLTPLIQTLSFIKKVQWLSGRQRCPCARRVGVPRRREAERGNTSAPGQRTRPDRSLSLLILRSGPCQANGPLRATAGPVWKPQSEPRGQCGGGLFLF